MKPVPHLVDFSDVERQMSGQGLVSLYPNSGAFGFPPGEAARSVGWVGPDDPSVREAARALMRPVPPPYEATLAALAARAWRARLPAGPVWVLPKAHWAYELQFGSHEWMPSLLESIGIAPADLQPRHDGTAVQFNLGEVTAFETMVRGLLERLLGSDFMLAWPGRPVVCTVHHHKQLWWTTTDAALLADLEAMVRRDQRTNA
jgi:hypothetical protein